MSLLVHVADLSICGHHFRRQQIVNRETVFSDEVADAPAQRNPTNAYRRGVAKPDGQSMRGSGRCKFASGETGLGPGCTRCCIDFQALHVREVQDDAALCDTMPD